ncbi:UDP-glucose 4-epimerase GalE [Planomicrobium sp. CPCC 101079]|uniref:UDP-glucose 4-epimerase GalE n=1 Tax=Planomicrobium sp. CPCC 101079 TaxID=2599618 RepID=UPI0011B3FF1B|nr:UDP-glucose 4-epimerase GalE [Planomicrobium sp. CPCC 101079]TWT03605.1 UDP-glucose 4-epimerase GalE [Planomicrobium sp. CPCC 101079]
MAILVCGGAGYIGSHTVKELIGKYEVVVLDNLSTGFPFLLDDNVTFVEGNLGDERVLDQLFTEHQIDAVFHFAANSLVGESVVKPLMYYQNNVAATVTLLQKMVEHGVNKFIFSSTAATYGIPDRDLITEETATNPINPYGRSKLMIEQVLADAAHAYGVKYVVLRYFNAAGAHASGEIGESHDPETHLVPIVLQHLLGQRDKISVFGTDYETADGTCVRDYIHVTDLANAHILAYEGLAKGNLANEVFNLGNGAGYSVKEIIDVCEKVSGKQATVEYADRRPGDPAVLVASSEKINKVLGWKPKFKLEEIIESAWKWHSK